MAKADVQEQGQGVAAGPVELLIGVSGPVSSEALRKAAAAAVLAGGGALHSPGSVAVAVPAHSGAGQDDVSSSGDGDSFAQESNGTAPPIRVLPYEAHGTSGSKLPWLPSAASFEGILRLAQEVRPAVCVVMNPDLLALRADPLHNLASPVLRGECDLAMPLYSGDRYEGLLNSAILAPLTRALYGKRVQFPLPADFAISLAFVPLLREPMQRRGSAGTQGLLWPGVEAAVRDRRICQVAVPVHHVYSSEGADLSTILAQVVGPAFAEMEVHAAAWQRVRGSTPTAVNAGPAAELVRDGDGPGMEAKPMIDAFQLGYRNLQDVWSLVLPPVTLLELKRLSRAAAESFHLPDALWARMVFDFAVAHRLRTLGRNHLLGALTPLYLGWVASYVGEVKSATAAEVEVRRERLARAFEEAKPYLVQRWRWPDRFNP